MIAEAFAALFSATTISAKHPRDPSIAKMFGLGNSNTAGVLVNHEKVMALPAIKRGVEIVSNKLFSMPWYVFRETVEGRTWDKSHPSWQCVSAMANEELSDAALRAQLVQWAMTWGNGCAVIDRPNWPDGPVGLYPLLPDRTELVRVSGDLAERAGNAAMANRLLYKTKIGDKHEFFERDDVLHIKGLGPNPYWGYDIVDLLSETFGGAIAKEEFSNRFFSGGANPTGFITMDGSLDEEAEETFIKSMGQAMHGLGKAHKIILLENGAKFQPVTVDPQKSQMIEGKQFDLRLLAMAIGIKAHKLIDGSNSAYASLEQANQEHKDDDILPWVAKWRKECHDKLLTEEQKLSGSHSIDLDDEALNWVPFSERASGVVELYNNGLITKDEGRRKVNFGPAKTPKAKQYRIPSNIVYEEDAAMVGTDRQPQSEPRQEDDRFGKLSTAYLEKIESRIQKQAAAKAAKGSKDFLAWLDTLATEQGPEVIQAEIDALFVTLRNRYESAVNTATSDEELKGLVCT
jgi:HK97 family phage portal protein